MNDFTTVTATSLPKIMTPSTEETPLASTPEGQEPAVSTATTDLPSTTSTSTTTPPPTLPTSTPLEPPPQASKLSFLDLPAELRNQIYTHALIQPTPISLPYAYERRPFREPALLRTARTIRAEATPLYYGGNVFEAPSPAAAHRFLHALQPAQIAHLRRFRPVDLILPAGSGTDGGGDAAATAAPTALTTAPAPPSSSSSTQHPNPHHHHRWFDALRMNINRLVGESGKGALSAEAVAVPVRAADGALRWLQVRDVAAFKVMPAAGPPTRLARDAGWSLEWLEEGEQEEQLQHQHQQQRGEMAAPMVAAAA